MIHRIQTRKAAREALTLALALAGAASGFAQSATALAEKQIASIGDSLRRNGNFPLHIIYVHGIGATGPGDSTQLRESICAYLKDCTTPAGELRSNREYADQGIFDLKAPLPSFTYMGAPVWNSQDERNASAPFVDHYVLNRKNGKSILVDELNWWPMVFPLKCRNILVGEAQLAGAEASYLGNCTKLLPDPVNPGRYDFYSWLSPGAAATLEASGTRAVWANSMVKIGLMDWGFSDALMAVGPLQPMMLEGIRQLVVKSVAVSGDAPQALAEAAAPAAAGSSQEYIVVSHSLGSFLMLAALNPEPGQEPPPAGAAPSREAAFNFVLRHTSQFYFFANQVPLLELAMLEGSAAPLPAAAAAAPANVSPTTGYVAQLQHWRATRSNYIAALPAAAQATQNQPQIIAFSDANDLLSWHMPDIEGITIVNPIVKNGFHWFWIFENPLEAHDNYDQNKTVIRTLMKPAQSAP